MHWRKRHRGSIISPAGESKVAAYYAPFIRDIQQASSCEICESQSLKD
jgi:hypothetical protein